MDQLQENYFLRIDLTVESSLFANKFTSPWTCLQTFVEYLLKLSELAFNKITSPWTWKISATHEHWPLQIKMIPQYTWLLVPYFISAKINML